MKSLLALLVAAFLAFTPAAHAVVHLPDDVDVEGSPNLDYGSASPDRTVEALDLNEPDISSAARVAVLKKYSHLDPKRLVDRRLLAKALLYWDANGSKFPNKSVISLVNFSIPSRKARYFNIDMKTGVVWAVHVAHGSKSDQDGDGIPEHFSNVDGSNMSSLGVFKASEVYSSTKFKNAMRIDGLQKTNSNARSRAVVVHSAWYVWESDLIAPGQTYGCFGLSESVAPKMIERIKDGSMIFAGLATEK